MIHTDTWTYTGVNLRGDKFNVSKILRVFNACLADGCEYWEAYMAQKLNVDTYRLMEGSEIQRFPCMSINMELETII